MGCILNAIDDQMDERRREGLCPTCGGILDDEYFTKYGYVCNKCKNDFQSGMYDLRG